MPNETPATRLGLALDMYEFGERMMRARLRRSRPESSQAEIDAAVQRWLTDRPDAVAQEAVQLITARGFNRYRDLMGALEEFLNAG